MPKKLTTDEFINKAKKVHGDKYDYSKVKYINAHAKVCIICPEHGEFWQMPSMHLCGHGCIDCVKKRKHTKESFINEAKKIHGDKYDYSKVNYVNNKTKVCIICTEHGEFWQRPDAHMQGKGCDKCGGTHKLLIENFIDRANELHKYKYDYSNVEYVNYETKVCIVCPEHGEFWQTPHSHLVGQGCPKCYGNLKLTKNEFTKKANKIHKYKYDYSKVNYVNYETKVCIVCPEHGEFWQTPHSHLVGQGCPKCYGLHGTTEEFIKRANSIHGDKYDYSKAEYINSQTKVCIICPKHGEFWQTPHSHLVGQGCPFCNSSKLENAIDKLLKKNNIKYERLKTFKWLVNKGHLYLDFYLPDYNVAIECQGEQHFEPVKIYGGIDGFLYRQKLDKLKFKLCNEHKINIFYYSNIKHNEYFSKIYENSDELIEKIYEQNR